MSVVNWFFRESYSLHDSRHSKSWNNVILFQKFLLWFSVDRLLNFYLTMMINKVLNTPGNRYKIWKYGMGTQLQNIKIALNLQFYRFFRLTYFFHFGWVWRWSYFWKCKLPLSIWKNGKMEKCLYGESFINTIDVDGVVKFSRVTTYLR